AENVKQRGVCRDLQIQIEKAVDQNSHTTEQRGHGHCTASRLSPILKFARRPAEDQDQKPDGDGESRQASLDQQLQIIVVRLVHEEGGVETAKFRIDDGKGAESPTEKWPLDKHAQAVAIDAEANPSAKFFASFG